MLKRGMIANRRLVLDSKQVCPSAALRASIALMGVIVKGGKARRPVHYVFMSNLDSVPADQIGS